jgi:hypothetical protein
MEAGYEPREDRFERLMNSLELVTARMIETAVTNSQLASSQTPEMRRLFDAWIACVSGEVERFFGSGEEVSLGEISEATGLSRESALALITCLDKTGRITVRGVRAEPGDGKNRDICGCVAR